jgi:peptide/nickel transport system ATP-binding protein
MTASRLDPQTPGVAHETPVLETRALTKRYLIGRGARRRAVHALTEVDLAVQRGEVLALVGESGSGKTTLARTIVALERASSGEIVVEGEPLPRHPGRRRLLAHRRRVQMIFQDPYASLDPLHSIGSTVGRPLRSFGIVPREQVAATVERLLDEVGLTPPREFLSRYPHELSGGQRQRVGIARALAASPSLIVADEPTSMLDVSIRLTIMNLLLDLQRRQGLSLIFITHDLASAQYMSDRVAIMYAGRIQEIGPTVEVMSKPRHPYTQLLREAAPDPEKDLDQAGPFEDRGDPPDLADLPAGCSFAARCPHAQERCREALPDLVELASNHHVRCILYA